MKAKLLLFAAPLALVGVAPAHATVNFGDQTLNNGTVLENVLIANNQSATTVTGTTNQTGVTVFFNSAPGTDTLVTTASGQAVITAADTLLNAVTISLAPGYGFTNLEFDLQDASAAQTVNVTAITNLGTYVHPYSFSSNGANWVGTASAGEYFTSVSWASSPITAGFDSMKQIRLGGVAAVPEASTWAMMLLGLGGIGWALRRKRHEVAKTAARISFA